MHPSPSPSPSPSPREESSEVPRKRSFEDSGSGSGSESDIPTHKRLHLTPRWYQSKAYEVAVKKNTILVLGTGLGKTAVAVMLINHLGHMPQHRHQLIVFLAPTVSLVNQQFQEIKAHTDLPINEFYGSLPIHRSDISASRVLVMTPQIFLDALRTALFTLQTVCLIIFDECHRATANHSYTQIMKEFYHNFAYKPKIFGMTASPVTRGVSSHTDCEDQISKLESILDSQIFTIDGMNELKGFTSSAKEVCKFYSAAKSGSFDLREKLQYLWSKCDGSFIKWQEQFPGDYRDMNDKIKVLQRRLSSDLDKILYCLDKLGLLCAYEAVKVCMENVPTDTGGCELFAGSSIYKTFHNDAFSAIEHYLQQGSGSVLLRSSREAVGYVSPKLYELLRIFEDLGYDDQVLCLIFVERIITAKVIKRFLRTVRSLSHFTVSYLTGNSGSVDALSPKLQKQTLESFRNGEVNLLFATDVVEEGIHVPNCSCVIRFDLPKTVRSYIQSRGRARQDGSLFIMMLERNNKKQTDHLFDMIRSERSVTDLAMNRDPDTCMLIARSFEKPQTYVVKATGASVTADSSVSLIHRYCETLRGDKYYIPKPLFNFLPAGSFYKCQLKLPPNAAFQTVVGPSSRNCYSSKQLVCLEACKTLHEMGALDDYLLPYYRECAASNSTVKSDDSAGGGMYC